MERLLEWLNFAFVASGSVMITPTNFLDYMVNVLSWSDYHGFPFLYLLVSTWWCDILPVPPDMSFQDDSEWLVEVCGRIVGVF